MFTIIMTTGGGVAPIRKEYLVTGDVEEDFSTNFSKEGCGPITDAIVEELSTELTAKVVFEKKNRKGMNKDRRKKMKQNETAIRAAAVRLCPSAFQPVSCKFGEKCTSEHDVQKYLEQKPADIGPDCPVFGFRGKCPYSYACRFGSSHTDESGNQISQDLSTPYTETLNTSSRNIQIALRKKNYDFSASEQALNDVSSKDFRERVGAMEIEKRKFSPNELLGKKYLAPLTTVGNLPFRRICVDYGAEVTCGEMALATSLLSGSEAEYSLLKRHPCERIFGVQLAGGFPDTMTKAAQIIVDNMQVDFIDINMGCPIDVVNDKGGGCALPNRGNKMIEVVSAMKMVMKDTPLSVKLRTGLKLNVLTADSTVRDLQNNGKGKLCPDWISFHPRSKEQRYTHWARWDFVPIVKEACGETPLWVCGDILGWEDYWEKMENNCVDGIMIGRGALIKPWIFNEIDNRRTWDISATERFDLLKKFVNYGLDHWGSDSTGVERTRRFLLEWLSFACRYIPAGLLEVLPQRMNDRPPAYRGRNELESLLSSTKASDWVEISKRLLGPPPEGFTFIPKHKASSY